MVKSHLIDTNQLVDEIETMVRQRVQELEEAKSKEIIRKFIMSSIVAIKGFNDTLPTQTAAWRSLEQQLSIFNGCLWLSTNPFTDR